MLSVTHLVKLILFPPFSFMFPTFLVDALGDLSLRPQLFLTVFRFYLIKSADPTVKWIESMLLFHSGLMNELHLTLIKLMAMREGPTDPGWHSFNLRHTPIVAYVCLQSFTRKSRCDKLLNINCITIYLLTRSISWSNPSDLICWYWTILWADIKTT